MLRGDWYLSHLCHGITLQRHSVPPPITAISFATPSSMGSVGFTRAVSRNPKVGTGQWIKKGFRGNQAVPDYVRGFLPSIGLLATRSASIHHHSKGQVVK